MRQIAPTHRAKFARSEPGFVITLVAVFMLFVVGAMAALSIDVVTFYTARSEAQLAADAAALAGARVLANSGVTSDVNAGIDGLWARTKPVCESVGKQVGASNQVSGQNLAGQMTVICNLGQPGNPTVSARVVVTVPTFFARIWGATQVTVAASASAEAYNPSGLATALSTPQALPVSFSCVKPWLMPNIDPLNTTLGIFDRSTGAIVDPILLGSSQSGMLVKCAGGDCSGGVGASTQWSYYPGDTSSTGAFAPPASTSVLCTPAATGFTPTDYQLAVTGCVQTPIACNTANVPVDISVYPARDAETFAAVNCTTHSATNLGDKTDITTFPAGPFQFIAGDENPLVAAGILASGSDVFVSDSLVTVPVYDTVTVTPNTVNLVGFVQLFLNPDGNPAPNGGQISTTVVNLVGCGLNASGNPVYGNGATAVPVRLITPP